jgi:hypothetical protein
MKKIKAYLFTIPKLLNYLLIASLVIIVLIELLSDTHEIVPFGAEFGRFVYSLGLSYIAAYIFYFVSVHLKEIKDKKTINPYISKQVFSIISLGKSMLEELKFASKVETVASFPTINEVEEICQKIDPESDARSGYLDGSRDNWFGWLMHCKTHHQERSLRLMSKIIFLDTALIPLISALDESRLFQKLRITIELTRMNTIKSDMILFKSDLFAYFSDIQALELYYNKHLKQYSK